MWINFFDLVQFSLAVECHEIHPHGRCVSQERVGFEGVGIDDVGGFSTSRENGVNFSLKAKERKSLVISKRQNNGKKSNLN